MEILSCHIENFGKLSDRTFDFQSGVNRICEENGFGKSTLAVFIRAMFYGLGGKGKKNDYDNERRKYRPWQGGVFGGQMIFNVAGKMYQMSRIFGEKESGDEFELREFETNLLSEDYSERIGEELFGIDSESFSRTVFLGQNDCKTVATDDIHAKIGNLSEQTDDMSSFEDAFATLEKLENKLSSKKVSGSLYQRKQAILECEKQFRDGKALLPALESLEIRRTEYLQELSELQDQMLRLEEQQKEVADWRSGLVEKERMEHLLGQREEAKAAYQKQAEYFTETVPKIVEVQELMKRCEDMERLKAGADFTRFQDEEEQEYKILQERFSEGCPSEEELASLQRRIKRLQQQRTESARLQLSDREEQRLSLLEEQFGEEKGVTARLLEQWSRRNTLLAMETPNQIALTSLEEKKNSDQEAQLRDKQQKRGFLAAGIGLLVVAVLVLLVVVTVLQQSVAAWVLCLVCGLFGAILLILGLSKKVRKLHPELQKQWEQLEDSIRKDRERIQKIEEEMASYFAKWGLPYEEEQVVMQLQNRLEEEKEYQRLLQQKQDAVLDPSVEKEAAAVRKEYQRYGLEEEEEAFSEGVMQLSGLVADYLRLQSKDRKHKKDQQAYQILREQYLQFLTKYGFREQEKCVLQLEAIKNHLESYHAGKEEWNRVEENWKFFSQKQDIPFLQSLESEEERLAKGKMTSLSEISEKLSSARTQYDEGKEKIRALEQNLTNLLEEKEAWEEGQETWQELTQLQEKEEQKYRCIRLAKDKLQKAKEVMTAKYAKPMLTAFCEYYELVTGESGGRFHMDANSQLTVDELGKQRNPAQFSCGSKDLMDICLRLAMVDAMYQQEKPVLIMDDPFVNLDDEKVDMAKRLLETVSEKYQIIYCTCSQSR